MAGTALRRQDALRRKPVAAATRAAEEGPRPRASRNLEDPTLYINRELSLLEFQRRVLEEAEDPSNPLLERVKFLSILSSNLDEFFMVRAAGLLKQVVSGSQEVSLDGRSAAAQLSLIRQQVCQLAAESHGHWRRELRPALERAGIRILEFADLTRQQRSEADAYFRRNVFPCVDAACR